MNYEKPVAAAMKSLSTLEKHVRGHIPIHSPDLLVALMALAEVRGFLSSLAALKDAAKVEPEGRMKQ